MTDEAIRQAYISLSISNEQDLDTQRPMAFLRTQRGWNLAHICETCGEIEVMAEVTCKMGV